MIRKNKRNLILIIFVIVTTLSAIGAYFTSYAMKNNIFTIGEISHDWQYLSKQEHLCSKCNAKEAHTWVDKNTYKECSGCKLKHSKIIYQLNGGKIQNAPTEYYSVDTINFTSEPTRDGYNFEGWTGSNGSTPQKNISIPKGEYGFKTYVANWKSLTLVDGETFSSKIPGPATSVVFTDEKAPDGATLTNLADDGRNGVVGWRDGDIYKVSTQIKGKKIYANPSCYQMFDEKSNLYSIDFDKLDTGQVTDMSNMFSGCCNLTSLDLSGFDTSKVTDMGYMFYNCSGLTNLDVAGFNTNQITGMNFMFYNCNSLTSLDISGFDTSQVTTMDGMFKDCRILTSLDISGFDTSQVTTMDGMFKDCRRLTSLDISGFDTSQVTTMDGMFKDCRSLTSLDLSSFDTSQVTDMRLMFQNCDNLTSLDVSRFNTSRVTDMELMFFRCYNLTSLDLSGFDTSKVTSMRAMFHSCYNLTSLDVSSFDTSQVTNMEEMFRFCYSLTNLDLSGFDTSRVMNMGYMFEDCSSLINLDVSSFDTSQVMHMDYMFRGCKKLQKVKLGSKFKWVGDFGYLPAPSSSNIPGADGKWYNEETGVGYYRRDIPCYTAAIYVAVKPKSRTMIDGKTFIRGFLSAQITTVIFTDEKAPANTTIEDVSVAKDNGVVAWYSADEKIIKISTQRKGVKVLANNDMSHMFDGEYLSKESLRSLEPIKFAPNFKIIDFSMLDTSNTTDMNHMFGRCILEKIIFGDFDTSKVTDMSGMFFDCNHLASLDLSGFDTSNVTNMDGMFDYCDKLQKVKLGSKFKWVGTKGYLPAPSSSNIPGADGKWYNEETGVGYYRGDIPNNTAATYVAVKPKSRTLLDGPTFNSKIPSSATTVIFTDEKAPSGANLTNLADDGKDDIVGWLDGTTYKVSTQDSNTKIMANPSCCQMFYNKSNLKEIKFDNFNTSQVTNMSFMFSDCDSITSLDVDKFDTSQVTDVCAMFQNCSNLTSLDVSGFDTSQVTDMSSMFNDCWNFTSLDISGFDTSKVTNMGGMFSNCDSLTRLDLSGFDTSKITNMTWMFNGCSNLTNLDLSGFDTSQVTNMSYMFNDCNRLKSLDVSKFNTSQVTNMSEMFCRCYSLTNLDLTGFDTSKVTNMGGMFSDCNKLQEVKLGSKFKWVGTEGYLPAQTSDNIPGADGKWYNETTGAGYAPANIPSNTAATYVASPNLVINK